MSELFHETLYQHYQHTETTMFTPDLPELLAEQCMKIEVSGFTCNTANGPKFTAD